MIFKTELLTGILLSGNEVSQILLSLVMTYFGGDGHRPRLAAIGILFSGVASLLIVVPHFVYGEYSPTTNSKPCHDDGYKFFLGRSWGRRFFIQTLITAII